MKRKMVQIVLAVMLAGCSAQRAAWRPTPDKVEESPAPIQEAARVTLVNAELGFVVIDYAQRAVPAIGTRVDLFRGEQKSATVRLTEPARGTFITGDILEGAPRVGDLAH